MNDTMIKLVAAGVLGASVAGVYAISQSRDSLLADAPSSVGFTPMYVERLPQAAKNAKHRKYVDLTCDGIEDMLEINDHQWGPGQDWKARVFPGSRGDDGIVHWRTTPYMVDLDLSKGWFSDDTKVDSAYIGNDPCGDIIFTEHFDGIGSLDKAVAKIALNQGDGRTFAYAQATSWRNEPFYITVRKLIADFQDKHGSSEEEIPFAIDWVDSNGKDGDDLHLFWQVGDSLYATVLTAKRKGNSVAFDAMYSTEVPDFFYKKGFGNWGIFTHDIDQLDTEQYNKDKFGDLMLYRPWGDTLELHVATNQWNNGPHYTLERPIHTDTHDMQDIALFEKLDSVQMNTDRCADVVHTGYASSDITDQGRVLHKEGDRIAAIHFNHCE